MAAGNVLLPDNWRVERSIAAIEREWRALEAEAISTPFQSYEWMSSLLTGADADPNAVFVIGSREGRPRIIFPLSLKHGTLTWLNEKWTNYNLPLVSSELFRSLDVSTVDRIWNNVRTTLGRVDASILLRQPLEVGSHPNSFAQWARVEEPTDIYMMPLGKDWSGFYENLYGPAMRKGLAKKLKRLVRDPSFVWTRVTDPAAIGEHIELMLRWKSDQLDMLGRRNPFSRPHDRKRFARFGTDFPACARVYAGYLGGKPIAINFLMEGKGPLLLYQMAYDEGPTSKFSPGRLLLNHTLRELISEGRTLLDFSVGDDPYKRELCTVTKHMTNSVRAHSFRGVPAVFKERSWIGFKTAVKSHPALLGFALKANAWLNTLAGRKPSRRATSDADEDFEE